MSEHILCAYRQHPLHGIIERIRMLRRVCIDTVDESVSSGATSLMRPAGDPCPSCVGVYLPRGGHTWYKCTTLQPYGDDDSDGVGKGCESEIAIAFAPHLIMSADDNAPDRETYYAVKLSELGAQQLEILYMLGYYRDPGVVTIAGYTLSEHNGDSEFIRLRVRYDSFDGRWKLMDAIYSAHYETPVDGTTNYPYDQLYYIDSDGFVDYGSLRRAPIAYVARDKHANYSNLVECNATEGNRCAGGRVWSRAYVDFSRNVGTRSHRLKDCVGSVMGEPGTECYWDTAWERFAGWQASGGVTPYWEILMAYGW